MNSIKKILFSLLAGILLVLLSACGGDDHRRIAYSDFIVFGASLSDTGNVYTATSGASPGSSPNYYMGRWSNGPLWIENVASSYGKAVLPVLQGGTNYAYGGAMTCTIATVTSSVPDMCAQVNGYLSSVSNKADANALYVMDASAVGNEITKVLSATVSATQITTVSPVNVTDMLQLLYDAGARRFLVTNVPDVGATPLVKAYGPTAVTTATNLSSGFNSALTVALDNFVQTRPEARVYKADFNHLLTKIQSYPSSYGLTNTSDACLSSGVVCASPETFLFWDSFHPTQAVGAIMSAYALGVF